MALIICGHQRSGTTLLGQLCHSHPDIEVSHEFGVFFDQGQAFSTYRRLILRRWWAARNRSFLYDFLDDGSLRGVNMLRNLVLVYRFLSGISAHSTEHIDIPGIEAGLKRGLSGARIVGDKHPDYVFTLDKLTRLQGLSRIAIYRDPRDMTSSALKAYTARYSASWPADLNVAAKVAERWVYTIGLMERHADKVHIIRYEDLVTDPQPTLAALGDLLGVDPQGFDQHMIHRDSIGKYRTGLSAEQVEDVVQIAGATMRHLNYEI